MSAACSTSLAQAQSDYPSRPVRIVIGFGAGAVADMPALTSDDVATALRTAGLDPLGSTPDEFARYIVSEVKKGAAVAQAAGLKK